MMIECKMDVGVLIKSHEKSLDRPAVIARNKLMQTIQTEYAVRRLSPFALVTICPMGSKGSMA